MPVKNARSGPLTREVAQFGVSYVQILDESGNLVSDFEPKLSREELVSLYRWMVLAREGDQRMLKLQRQGRIGTFGLCTGQEAAICAPTFAMTERDWFVGCYREMGALLMRGYPLSQMYVYFNGYEEGSFNPQAGRTLPISIIVGAQTLHAVGIAYAMKVKGEKDSAVVTYIGDGGTSQGDFAEAMNFAAVWQTPTVFVCQNNQWAISIPRSAQTRSRTIAQKAIAYEMPGIQVDGNDPLALYHVTREALERARAGEGPTFIEALTYRLMAHTTADDPTRYRPDEEVERWWKRDPIPRLRAYMEKKGFWNAKDQEAMETEIRTQVEDAVKEFESQAPYAPDTPFDYVYGQKHASIEEQRAEFLANLEREKREGLRHG